MTLDTAECTLSPMTKQPLPRYRADIQVVIEVSAADFDAAEDRLDRIANEIKDRLSKTTFRRLPGKPEVVWTMALDPAQN